MEKLFIKSHGYDLSLCLFTCEKPKAIIQMAHGMQEHKERYEKFASFLNENGYIIVTADMRGHGYEADKLGHFNDKEGYKLLIDDQVEIANFIKNKKILIKLSLLKSFYLFSYYFHAKIF